MTEGIDQEQITEIVSRVLDKLGPRLERGPGAHGIFSEVDEAVTAAGVAQLRFECLSLEKREQIIAAIRQAALSNVRAFAEMAVKETGIGRVEDKVVKNILAASKTPGTEDIGPSAYTGDHGLTLVEMAPFGVIGAITPVTNPSATIISNSIGMIAAGNSVVFCPHPSAKLTSAYTISLINDAIVKAGGPPDLVTALENPTIEAANALMRHRGIAMVVVTGGPAVVKAALCSGKKAIGAGAGNPPVLVDETADLFKAAADIVAGASFDNNLPCTCEKELIVVDSVADLLIQRMQREGAYLLHEPDVGALTKLAILPVVKEGEPETLRWMANKECVGKDAWRILAKIGIEVSRDIRLIIFETDQSHPFAQTEQMMPVLPIIRARTVEEGIEKAIRLEKGYKHTAIMHSKNIDNMTAFARAIKTTVFVKNAPSYAGLGAGGEGFSTFTIAGPTGEGMTSARSFTRQRRCVLVDGFRII